MDKPLSLGQASIIAQEVGRFDVLRLARCISFVAIVLAIWVSLRPFVDLGDPDYVQVASGKLAYTYITLTLLAMVAFCLTILQNTEAFVSLVTPGTVLLCFWILINTLFSNNFEISSLRLFLTVSVLMLAACLLLLPNSQAELDVCLGASALILLTLCYLGVFLAPNLSMHMPGDLSESQLAGDWRGTFGHKNIAAPVMAMLIFVGIYLISRKATILGSAISLLSIIFLIRSGGKSAMGMCMWVFLLGGMVSVVRTPLHRAIICFLPLFTLNALTVGSVFSDTLADITALLPFDTTFTGRTDIWKFAISSLSLHPVLGYGFAAFWGDPAIEYLVKDDEMVWAAGASHSHNGYLDTALTMGYPGLILVLLVFVVMPFRNFNAITATQNDGPLSTLFLRLWLFGIYLSSVESFLLDRMDPIWFNFLISIFGLHYISRFRLTSEQAVPDDA